MLKSAGWCTAVRHSKCSLQYNATTVLTTREQTNSAWRQEAKVRRPTGNCLYYRLRTGGSPSEQIFRVVYCGDYGCTAWSAVLVSLMFGALTAGS